MITIRPVPYSQILDAPNWPELQAEYADECAIPELGEPSPQRELYELLEKSGGFKAFGVYDGETLVGFASVLIYILPHYGKKIAATESIFIAEQRRYGGVGEELLSFIEAYARRQGCGTFLYSAPVGSRFSRLLSLDYPRYRLRNNVYLRKL